MAVHALVKNVNLPANDGYLLTNFSGCKPPSAVCSMAGSNQENAHIFVMVSGGRQASVHILGGLFGAGKASFFVKSGCHSAQLIVSYRGTEETSCQAHHKLEPGSRCPTHPRPRRADIMARGVLSAIVLGSGLLLIDHCLMREYILA